MDRLVRTGLVGIAALAVVISSASAGDGSPAKGSSDSPVSEHALPIAPDLGTRTPVSPRTIALAKAGRLAVHVYADRVRTPALGAAVHADPAHAITRRATVGGDGFLVVETTPAGARRIAALPGVLWVEQAPEPTPRNDTLRRIVQTGDLGDPNNPDPLGGPFDLAGLTGAGQIAGLIDQPLDWDHCAFDDSEPIGPAHRKIAAYNAPVGAVSTHGTHVAGTLAGDSGAHGDLYGVARGARMVFAPIPAFDESTLYERLALHAQQGARIHSNSWGDEQSGVYGGLARAVDAFCWDNDEHLVVVAVANQGALRTPENAKNALAVAASLDAPLHDRFCVGARGPTTDGRRKPEIVAPGCSIFSAYPFGGGCGTVFSTGTSMATPAVAGAALIARQYFTEGWHPAGEPVASNAFTPSGALLKAVLLAGTADLGEEPGWPGDREGWGRVRLAGSLPLGADGPDRLIVRQAFNNTHDALTTGDDAVFGFSVDDASRPVRIALSWHDAPGAFGATDPVVNDLDLVVTAPDGSVFVGNDIDPATGASVVRTPMTVSPDTRNNTEVVAIPLPSAGEYEVRVAGSGVAVGRQGFGLAIVGAVTPAAEVACSAADVADPLGQLDLADIGAFIASFTERDPAADLNGDGLFDLSDLSGFIAAFSAGCP